MDFSLMVLFAYGAFWHLPTYPSKSAGGPVPNGAKSFQGYSSALRARAIDARPNRGDRGPKLPGSPRLPRSAGQMLADAG
jgi:hypothetical protein